MGRTDTRIRTLTSPLADRSLRRLWYARTVSELGNWAARIALSLSVYAGSGSALAATAVTAVSVLPHLGIGQLLGTLADRFPHRTVMVTADIARGLIYLVLAGTDLPVPYVLALAFLAGTGDPPFVAAYSAALPQLAGERYLVVQTLFSSTRQAMVLVGFALGGALVAASSPSVALALNGASFFVGAVFLAGIRSTRSSDRSARQPLIRPAVRALTSDRLIVVSAGVVTMGALLGIAVESLVVAYADHLGVGPRGAGLLATVAPAAAVMTSFFLPSEGRHVALVRLVCRTSAVMTAVAFLVFVVDSPMPLVLVGFLAAGAMDILTVPAGVVIGQRLPQASRGTAFSFLEGVLMAAHATGAVTAGLLASVMSVPLAAATLAVPAGATALVGLFLVRGQEADAEVVVRGADGAGADDAGDVRTDRRDGAPQVVPGA
jgi:predicted MFS family arabinose efflux permease